MNPREIKHVLNIGEDVEVSLKAGYENPRAGDLLTGRVEAAGQHGFRLAVRSAQGRAMIFVPWEAVRYLTVLGR